MSYLKKTQDFDKVMRLLRGYAKNSELAEKMHCSTRTALDRMKSPENFTLGELKKICQGLHIPLEELRSAITW